MSMYDGKGPGMRWMPTWNHGDLPSSWQGTFRHNWKIISKEINDLNDILKYYSCWWECFYLLNMEEIIEKTKTPKTF
jgi:hypothetical protein